MTARYICTKCKHIYETMTQDDCCERPGCFGEPLVPITLAPSSAAEIEGLCVLVCDASGSMDNAAFPESRVTKLKLVVSAVQRAISELSEMSKRDTAFIAIIAFGGKAALVKDRQGAPFVKSVQNIITEFGDDLAEFLFDYFGHDRGNVDRRYTDISAALQLAKQIADGALSGDLSPFGIRHAVSLIEHSDIVTLDGRQIPFPNVRVMAYSDGAHNPDRGAVLTNAFASMQPSPLMTAFIGSEGADENARQGADQMKALANTCPEHGHKGYFLINTLERHAQLRKLFRMASGASGFCPQCLKAHASTFEE